MKKPNLVSPIARRLKEKGPNKYCLVKTRVITEDDMEYVPKWAVIKSWYEDLESDPNRDSIHMILQSMVNALLYQERIYFAITRSNVVELFKNDKNWKDKKRGMKNASYKDLLAEMVESGMFEEHPENDRFYAQRKPRIFKLVDETILSLMKPVSEAEQLKQVFDFVENNPGDAVGDEAGDAVGDAVGDLVLVLDKVLVGDEVEEEGEEEPTSEALSGSKKQLEFMDVLVKMYPNKMPRFEELSELVSYAIENCHDFDADNATASAFERYLKNFSSTTKGKKHITELVTKFKGEAEKQVRLSKLKNIELAKPDITLASNVNKTTVNMDEEAENYTLKMLNNSFGKENIKVLKRKLEQAEDEHEKVEIKAEIEFWESVV